jgi:hypothetical protein
VTPRPARKRVRKPLETLGWREWAAFPDLGIEAIKAKLDTGARTSALHAFDLEHFERDGVSMVRFEVHPHQRSSADARKVEVAVLDERWIRNSGGGRELRPVIETTLGIGERSWTIELTLTRRDQMGFRLLLGRQAIRSRALVDPGKSFRAGRRHGRGKIAADEKIARSRSRGPADESE